MYNLYEIKPLRFLLWWIACSIFVFPLAIVAVAIIAIPSVFIVSTLIPNYYQYNFIETTLSILATPIIGAIIAACMAFLQRWLLRTKLYWVADRWLRWSMIGGAIGGCVVVASAMFFEEFIPAFYYDDNFFLYYLPIYLAVVSSFQMINLRHAVKQSWLWIIANIVAGLVFAGVLVGNQPNYYHDYYGWITLGIGFLALSSLGLITGFTMLFLFEKKLLPMEGEKGEFELDDAPKSVWDRAI